MVSRGSVGLGLGITLGVIGVIVIGLIVVSIFINRMRKQSVDDELTRRRNAQRRRHERDQENWRERRLRDVVLVLLDRGEVEEGVPLAFQVASRNEVPARRELRSNRDADIQRIEEDLVEEADAQLDPETRAIVQRTLQDHLIHGRPADASPGPDVLQLLLDGQELRQQSEFNASEMRSIHGEDTGGSGNSGDGTNTNLLSPLSAEEREQQRQQQRHDSIIRQLRSPNGEERKLRREERALEIYGVPVSYTLNPANDGHRSPPLISTVEFEQSMMAPQSPISRLLGPLSPFKRKRRVNADNNNHATSFSAALMHDENQDGGTSGGDAGAMTSANNNNNNFLRRVSNPVPSERAPTSGDGVNTQPDAPTLRSPPTRSRNTGGGNTAPF